MKNFLVTLFVALLLLTGCGKEGAGTPAELGPFFEELKDNGVDGSVLIRPPFNADMDYVAEYAIAKYASTRIISLFKFKDAEKAEANLRESLKNNKLSGQARNGKFVMVATFFPADEEAVGKIRKIFLAQKFD